MKEREYVVNASTLMERKRTNSSEFTPLSSIQPFDGTEDGGSDEVHSHGNRSWRFASITVVGEIVGSGVLGLPYAMKNLGWLLGIAACPIFGLCAAYAGHLLSRAKNSYRPKCKSYVDLAEYTMGSGFAKFTRFAIMLNWVMLLPYYMVGATDALLVAISSSNVCFHHASLIVVAVLIVCLSLSLSLFLSHTKHIQQQFPLQLQSLHGLTKFTFVSDVAIVLAIVLMLGDFSSQSARTDTTTALPVTSNFLDGYNGLSSFIFAFSGHSMFLEIMSEMETPKDFTKSLKYANTFMSVLYFISSSWSYMILGDSATGFMPDMVKSPAIQKMVGLFLAYHIIVSYLLTNQPLVLQILKLLRYEKSATSTVNRKVWGRCSLSIIKTQRKTHSLEIRYNTDWSTHILLPDC